MKRIYYQIEDKEIIDNLRLHTIVGAINALLLCGVIIAFGVWVWHGFPVLFVCSLVILLPVSSLFTLFYYKRYKNVNLIFLKFCVWDTLILTTILHYVGDIKGPFAFIYLVPIIMVGTIFSLKRIIIFISICVGSYLCLIIFEGLGIISSIHPPGVSISVGYSWTISTVAIILLTGVGIILAKTITQRREKEYELAKVTDEKYELAKAKDEKLAAITQIASEVVHEIKNPLSVIKAAAYILRDTLPKEEVQKRLDQMDKATDRITLYINDLLNFSKPPVLKLRAVEVNQVLEESLKELPPEILAGIKIDKDFEPELPQIKADPERLKQVFANLIKNASESMEEEIRQTERAKLAIRSELEEGFIKLTISDTGRGIPEETIMYIFDPFFTTKGKGTGLGLPICQRIVDAHKGEIEVVSKVGKGTSFIIRLRVNDEDN